MLRGQSEVIYSVQPSDASGESRPGRAHPRAAPISFPAHGDTVSFCEDPQKQLEELV